MFWVFISRATEAVSLGVVQRVVRRGVFEEVALRKGDSVGKGPVVGAPGSLWASSLLVPSPPQPLGVSSYR